MTKRCFTSQSQSGYEIDTPEASATQLNENPIFSIQDRCPERWKKIASTKTRSAVGRKLYGTELGTAALALEGCSPDTSKCARKSHPHYVTGREGPSACAVAACPDTGRFAVTCDRGLVLCECRDARRPRGPALSPRPGEFPRCQSSSTTYRLGLKEDDPTPHAGNDFVRSVRSGPSALLPHAH